jgi:hypothetical protein
VSAAARSRALGAAVALLGASALLAGASGAAAAPGGQSISPAKIRYARIRRVCPPARPGRATCFALVRVPVASKNAAAVGAKPYTLNDGASESGPGGGLTPAQLASAYEYNSTEGGAGQTVAIVDAYDEPKIEADLGKFDENYEFKSKATSLITQTTATLSARVNPDGQTVTECKFEYGTSTKYGSSAPCKTLPGSGSSPVEVSAKITALTPNTEYHFRVVTKNAGGTIEGPDVTFKTLKVAAPAVETKAASAVGQTTATLNASVNPRGAPLSTCKFEYGTTTGYGSSAPCATLPGSRAGRRAGTARGLVR